MSQSVKIYIEAFLRNKTAVGIVSFNSAATLHAPMTVLTNSAARKRLSAKVPASSSGGTSISAGLNECHKVRIILLSTQFYCAVTVNTATIQISAGICLISEKRQKLQSTRCQPQKPETNSCRKDSASYM